MTHAIYRVPRGTSNPFDSIQNELNAYADKGYPLGVALSDAYPTPSLAPSGVLWGSANESSFAANVSTMAATTTRTATAGVMLAVPFIHRVGFGLGGIGFSVVTGDAAGLAVFGLYDSVDDGLGNYYPRRKLWQSTEVATTANNTAHWQAPALTLELGRVYWMVHHAGGANTTIVAPSLFACDTILGYATGVGLPALQTHLSASVTYSSSMPALYPSGHTPAATVPPFIWGYYDPALAQTFTRSFPIWSPAEDGYAVRGARLLNGRSAVRSGSGRPFAKVSIRIVNASGTTTLGTFDTRNNILSPGVPFYLTDIKTDSTPLPKDSVLEAYIEQAGWPLLSVSDCAVCCDVVRTRP